MLRLERVVARIGDFRLQPLNLTVTPGACHVLLGPSGSGKSSVLELIVGFRAPASGRIVMKGRDLVPVSVEGRGIGYLPQRLALFPHLTVGDNIGYGIRCRRRPTSTDRILIDSLGRALGIDHLSTRFPESLSGGERQRVALARALAPAPEVLVLDEPFSSLNETLRRDLWTLLRVLQQEYRFSLLMVTHDLEEAFFLADHISILINGSLHQSDAKGIVFRRPATVEVASFLGIRNLFSAEAVGKENGSILLDCKSLGTRLIVEAGSGDYSWLTVGDAVTVGIRSELVSLRRQGQADLPGELRLDGEVMEVTETGRGLSLFFRPKTADSSIEVTAGAREAATLDMDGIQIGLPASHLFCLRVNNSWQFHSGDRGRRPT